MMGGLFLILLSVFTQLPDVEYDPFVAELIGVVSADSVTATIAAISGEVPVSVGGEPDSLPCRFAYSPGALRTALWLTEQLEASGIAADTSSFIPVQLYDVALLSTGEGFACGWAGSWVGYRHGLFHTTDAGSSWEVVQGLETNHLTAVALFTADSVWVISKSGRIAHTVNGSDWEEIGFRGSALYSLAWTDSRTGWAVGDSGVLVKTTDAWENFTELHPVTVDLRYVDFFSEARGWIASREDLWMTTDGAESWFALSHPLRQICGLAFTDSLHGYLIGQSAANLGAVYETADGGSSWYPLIDTLKNTPRTIRILSQETLWVAGDGGLLIYSTDGGSSWQPRSIPGRAAFNALDFAADGRGVVVGFEDLFFSADGALWQRPDTTNLGLMWNVVATLPGADSTMVLLTAHYDARSEEFLTYTPGADDNGSGVAAVLECARVLAQHSWRHTLKFVLFSGEEVGLFGSHRYVTEAVGTRDSILAVLNADMFAYDGNGDAVVDVNSNPDDALAQAAGSILMDVIEVYDIDLAPTHYVENAKYNSDHYYFWQERIPAVFLGEDRYDFNPFYHTTGDLLSELNPAHIGEGVRACVGWMAHMAGLDSLVDIEEPPVSFQKQVSLKLSSSLLRSSGWLEVSAPYSITPIIYDASGRRVEALATVPALPQSIRIPLEVSDLPSGVYWISIQGTKGLVSEKFVRVR